MKQVLSNNWWKALWVGGRELTLVTHQGFLLICLLDAQYSYSQVMG